MILSFIFLTLLSAHSHASTPVISNSLSADVLVQLNRNYRTKMAIGNPSGENKTILNNYLSQLDQVDLAMATCSADYNDQMTYLKGPESIKKIKNLAKEFEISPSLARKLTKVSMDLIKDKCEVLISLSKILRFEYVDEKPLREDCVSKTDQEIKQREELRKIILENIPEAATDQLVLENFLNEFYPETEMIYVARTCDLLNPNMTLRMNLELIRSAIESHK